MRKVFSDMRDGVANVYVLQPCFHGSVGGEGEVAKTLCTGPVI